MSAHWHHDRHAYATLPLPRAADVLVVGGGIVGLVVALALAEAGRAPLVVERAQVLAGASGRNGGLLLPGTAELYLDLARRWGRTQARALWAMSTRGAAQLVEWLSTYDVDCLWRPEGGLHVALDEAEQGQLLDNQVALVDDGFDATWLDRAALSGFSDLPLPATVPGALYLPGGGPLHSGRLVTGLARAAQRRGTRISEGVAVRALSLEAEGLRVTTDQGALTAKAVVLAANAWVGQVWPALGALVLPVRGQVQVTEPLAGGGLRGAWYLHHGYEYFQQLPDGRVVLGGMRWAAADREEGQDSPAVNAALHERLTDWFGELFPAWAPLPVAGRWAGIMAFTADRLPLIGPLDESGRLWVAAGFNGHGLPFAPLAAEIVAAGLAGRRLPGGAHFFSPDRPTLRPITAGGLSAA